MRRLGLALVAEVVVCLADDAYTLFLMGHIGRPQCLLDVVGRHVPRALRSALSPMLLFKVALRTADVVYLREVQVGHEVAAAVGRHSFATNLRLAAAPTKPGLVHSFVTVDVVVILELVLAGLLLSCLGPVHLLPVKLDQVVAHLRDFVEDQILVDVADGAVLPHLVSLFGPHEDFAHDDVVQLVRLFHLAELALLEFFVFFELSPAVFLAFDEPGLILRVDAVEFEFNRRRQIVLRLVNHLLLGGLELGETALGNELDARVEEDDGALRLLLLVRIVVLFDELVETLGFDKLAHEEVVFARVLLRPFILLLKIRLEVEEVV